MALRRARLKDIPGIMDLLVQVDMVHHNGRPDLFRGPATKYSADELAGILADESRPVFVMTDERDEKVLGHAFCLFEKPASSGVLVPRKTLYIDDICVDEHSRGRQVGRALFEHVRQFAMEQDCYNITLNVWSCNPGAMRFYEKLGLVPYKVGMEMILGKRQEELE